MKNYLPKQKILFYVLGSQPEDKNINFTIAEEIQNHSDVPIIYCDQQGPEYIKELDAKIIINELFEIVFNIHFSEDMDSEHQPSIDDYDFYTKEAFLKESLESFFSIIAPHITGSSFKGFESLLYQNDKLEKKRLIMITILSIYKDIPLLTILGSLGKAIYEDINAFKQSLSKIPYITLTDQEKNLIVKAQLLLEHFPITLYNELCSYLILLNSKKEVEISLNQTLKQKQKLEASLKETIEASNLCCNDIISYCIDAIKNKENLLKIKKSYESKKIHPSTSLFHNIDTGHYLSESRDLPISQIQEELQEAIKLLEGKSGVIVFNCKTTDVHIFSTVLSEMINNINCAKNNIHIKLKACVLHSQHMKIYYTNKDLYLSYVDEHFNVIIDNWSKRLPKIKDLNVENFHLEEINLDELKKWKIWFEKEMEWLKNRKLISILTGDKIEEFINKIDGRIITKGEVETVIAILYNSLNKDIYKQLQLECLSFTWCDDPSKAIRSLKTSLKEHFKSNVAFFKHFRGFTIMYSEKWASVIEKIIEEKKPLLGHIVE